MVAGKRPQSRMVQKKSCSRQRSAVAVAEGRRHRAAVAGGRMQSWQKAAVAGCRMQSWQKAAVAIAGLPQEAGEGLLPARTGCCRRAHTGRGHITNRLCVRQFEKEGGSEDGGVEGWAREREREREINSRLDLLIS